MPTVKLTRMIQDLDAEEIQIVIDITPRGSGNRRLAQVIDAHLRDRYGDILLRTNVGSSRVRAYFPISVRALARLAGLHSDLPGQLHLFTTPAH